MAIIGKRKDSMEGAASQDAARQQARQQAARPARPAGKPVTRLSRIAATAVAVAIVAAAFGIYGMWRATASEKILEQDTVSVLVAATEIPAGHTIEPADLTATDMLASSVPTGAATAAADIVGRTTVAPVTKGTAFTTAMLTGADAMTLAGVVAEGKVAATIVINEQSGLSGMIHQGDKVDVYDSEFEPAAIIARSATVIALTDDLEQHEKGYTSVTLELDEGEAPQVVTTASAGHAVLVMRPVAEGGLR